MYQPSGGAPVASVWMRIAAAISTRSSDSDMSLCSIHFRLWLAMSQPASFMAATTSGFRFSAIATPNTVAGKLRSVNVRHSRQKPAREPYSNIDSILAWRWPGQGCAPSTSDRKASEARSPSRILFSPPSSKFTTNWTATRALPGHLGSGGLRP